LAVKLLASAAQSGESIADLRRAWERERTSMLTGGSSSKNHNLEVSIKISLDSRTVRANSDAIRLLSLLCLLPDGAERSSLDKITSIKKHDSAVRTLKAVSLIYEEYSRLRVLSPIREYIHLCSDLQTHEDDLRAVSQHYKTLASKGTARVDDTGFISASEVLPPEQGNIHSVLLLAIHQVPPAPDLARALEKYTWFLNSTGPSADLLEQMVKIEDWGRHLDTDLQANIRLCLAEAYRKTRALDQSLEQLELVRELAKEEDLPFEAACSLKRMGIIFTEQGKSKKAMDTLQAAKAEFASIGNQRARYGELDCMLDLGRCLSSDGQYEKAQKQLLQASELLKKEFPEKRFLLAFALRLLAATNLELGDLDSATSLAEESLTEMKKLGLARSQGFALYLLGKILLKKGDLEHSIKVLEESIPLLSSSRAHSKAGRARQLLDEAISLLNEDNNINESTSKKLEH